MMLRVLVLACVLCAAVNVAAFRLQKAARASVRLQNLKAVVDAHDLMQHASSIGDALQNVLHHNDVSMSSSLWLADGGSGGDGAAQVAVAAKQSETAAAAAMAAKQASGSIYSKVDKTGPIGFVATYIEAAIDFGHSTLQGAGIQNSYGYAIIAFTLFIKALTLPLTTTQLQSTTRMQKLTPLQNKIKDRFPDKKDEQTKNQMLSQLFQVANVNPLAGCLPALAQIPIFISLYRALQNLIAENKLDEPFLWIPDLQGPVYNSGPGTSMDWIKSVFTGNPELGVHDTLAFLTLPMILFVSQTISQKVLQPPKDPNKVYTDQELFSQNLVANLPFIVAFFSINVPAGLALYWIVNNVMTTAITLFVKMGMKDEVLPPEVDRMMAQLEAGPGRAGGAKGGAQSSGLRELKRAVMTDSAPKNSGFGATLRAIDAEASRNGLVEPSATSSSLASPSTSSAMMSSSSDAASTTASTSEVTSDDDASEEEETSTNNDKSSKRKKRVKPAKKNRK